jgi:hypothetical protein
VVVLIDFDVAVIHWFRLGLFVFRLGLLVCCVLRVFRVTRVACESPFPPLRRCRLQVETPCFWSVVTNRPLVLFSGTYSSTSSRYVVFLNAKGVVCVCRFVAGDVFSLKNNDSE